jgi:hypothetical protein
LKGEAPLRRMERLAPDKSGSPQCVKESHLGRSRIEDR